MRRLLTILLAIASLAAALPVAFAQTNAPPERSGERGCESERKHQVTS